VLLAVVKLVDIVCALVRDFVRRVHDSKSARVPARTHARMGEADLPARGA
jgi:hypothetical protein